MGRYAREPLRDPFQLLIQRAHTYAYRKKYLQVVVFSKWWTDVDLLMRTFGGNVYKHLGGYHWLLSDRDELVNLVKLVEVHLPSQWGFEDKIIQYYMQEKTPD